MSDHGARFAVRKCQTGNRANIEPSALDVDLGCAFALANYIGNSYSLRAQAFRYANLPAAADLRARWRQL